MRSPGTIDSPTSSQTHDRPWCSVCLACMQRRAATAVPLYIRIGSIARGTGPAIGLAPHLVRKRLFYLFAAMVFRIQLNQSIIQLSQSTYAAHSRRRLDVCRPRHGHAGGIFFHGGPRRAATRNCTAMWPRRWPGAPRRRWSCVSVISSSWPRLHRFCASYCRRRNAPHRSRTSVRNRGRLANVPPQYAAAHACTLAQAGQ